MRVLGWDIGGANIKAACGLDVACVVPFELWKHPMELSAVMRSIASEMPPVDSWAVTMTGELCDCFQTKRDGVACILDNVLKAAGVLPARVWQTNGELVDMDRAKTNWMQTSAANWHVLATYAARLFCQDSCGLLMDIGSTTSDIIPLKNGIPVPVGLTDTQRLVSGELVYTGVSRTPIASLVRKLPTAEGECPVATEFFASTLDVYLLLGDLEENAQQNATADGRPATKKYAAERLARMVCGDVSTIDDETILRAARAIAQEQFSMLSAARDKVIRDFHNISVAVIAGSGGFLAARLANEIPSTPRVVSLKQQWGAANSAAACAAALSVLGGEEF